MPFPRQAGGKGHHEHSQRALKLHFPRQAEGKCNREGPQIMTQIVRTGPLLGILGEPSKRLSLDRQGTKPSRAFPESPANAFSSTGRRKRKSQGTQMTPNRLLLGLMVRGLELPFPRQAGGKGHREHAQRAPKSHFPRQAEGNRHREGPKRRPASTDESPFWRP